MKILVTGATGFLGSFLTARLAEDGHHVVGVGTKTADLTRDHWYEAIPAERFDHIYHLAAWTQAGDFCLYHPGEQWTINQKINTNVVAWWREQQPQAKMICMGTSCGYDPRLPLSEDHYLEGTPEESLYTYAMTKRMLLVGLRALKKQYGAHYLYAIPSTLYGPEYHLDGRQMHFIFDLMVKVLRGKYRGDRVVLWGDGWQKREIFHVRDFVDALVELNRTCDDEVVNIGAGREYSIREFADMICKVVGYDPGRIEYDTSRYVGVTSKCLSIEKLRKLLPGAKCVPIDQGLAQTIAWLQENAGELFR